MQHVGQMDRQTERTHQHYHAMLLGGQIDRQTDGRKLIGIIM